MKKVMSLAVATLFSVLGLTSGDLFAMEMSSPKISGFIDTTYTDSDKLDKDGGGGTFNLNTAHINLDGSQGKAGYHVGLDFGTNQAAFATNNIQEAYITLKHGDTCVLTVGKFVTIEGIEVIDSGMNPTITRGSLFTFAEPFSHTGVKMDHKFGKMLSLTLGVVNGWDVVTDTNSSKPVLARVGVNLGDPLSFGLGGYWGPRTTTAEAKEPETSVDLTGVSKWGPLAINFQWNQGSQTVNSTKAEWSGWGIQPVYWVSETVWIGGRYESFDDKNGGRTGTAGKESNISIAPGMKVSEATTLRAEYRYDKSEPTSGTESDTNTTSVELIYAF